MNRKQRETHKQSVQESQEKKRLCNKEHPDELRERVERHNLDKKWRLTRREKRELKRIKKKKIQRLKSLRRRQEITVEEYDSLRGVRDWLLKRVVKLEAKKRIDHNEGIPKY